MEKRNRQQFKKKSIIKHAIVSINKYGLSIDYGE